MLYQLLGEMAALFEDLVFHLGMANFWLFINKYIKIIFII